MLRRFQTQSLKKKENMVIAAASAQSLKESQQPSGYGTELQILSGHTDIVRHVLRVDDRLLVSASDDNTAIVWNYQTGECIQKLEGHKRPITCMLLLEDSKGAGSLLLTGSSDKSIRVWDLHSGECKQVLSEHKGSVKCLCLIHDPTKRSPIQPPIDMQTILPGLPVTYSPSSTSTITTTATSAKEEETEKASEREEHWFCSGGNDKNIHIWHQKSDGVIEHTGTIVRVDDENMNCMLAVNSTFIVTGSSNINILQVYSLEKMAHHRFANCHREAPQCLERLSDSAFVSGSLDGMIVVWHATDTNVTPTRVLNMPSEYFDNSK